MAGIAAVSNELLRPQPVGTMELWTWVERDKRDVPVVRLENAAILVPARDLGVLRRRYRQK